MKVKIYKNKTTIAYITQSMLEELNLTSKSQDIKINNTPFKATIMFTNRLTKKGAITRTARLIIPKNISSYLNLKNKQEAELEII